MAELKPIIEQSMIQYAGAVLQSRALVDVRDCLKPSARQIFYCMDKYKYVASKPFQKTMAVIGDAMKHFYIHGDSSCEGVIMRAGQPFAMRYPLVEVKGNGGTLLTSGNWAAPRYTDARLSKLAAYLFNDINKNTIDDWRDNYADNEQYPGVLPTKGFYNLVNGTTGIGIGMASSCPQYNLRELNSALIHLIDNPDCNFDEIYCAPDFATGAILYNEDDVKESMKNGTGLACKLRSVVEFNSEERCFIITEIPYGVYTNTICMQLEEIINGDENPGIERFNDLTGSSPLLKIYLTKNANPDKVLKYLYKNTFLQYHYSINFTMLDNGRYPKVFSWKEMLQAHIDHERLVYKRAFEFDLNKIKSRIHIIDGLLICMAKIDEVVQTIRNSESSLEASLALQKGFLLDEIQAKAVLDMKLSRLAHLEVEKLKSEYAQLQSQMSRINNILNDENLFKEEIKKGWREVADKFGDERRTKILNISANDEEPTEIRSLQLSLTNKNAIFVSEMSTLYTQRRGGVGNKMKMDKGEYVISTTSIETNETLLLFTQDGDFYSYKTSNLPIEEKVSIESLISLKSWQKIKAISAANEKNTDNFILFITRNGYIKKSDFSEYSTNRSIGIRAIGLEEGDEIANVIFTKDEKVGIITSFGNFLMVRTDDIRPVGRAAKGIKAIKLNDDDYVNGAHSIPTNTEEIISISGAGLCKRTKISEFIIQTRNTKGSKIQKLVSRDYMADFIPISKETSLLIVSTNSCIKIPVQDIPLHLRVAQGNKTIKLAPNENVIGLTAT